MYEVDLSWRWAEQGNIDVSINAQRHLWEKKFMA